MCVKRFVDTFCIQRHMIYFADSINLFLMKTILDSRQCGYNPVGRAHSSLSVSAVDYFLSLPVNPPSPALSTVTLTPGRIRNIDQDMEALRASRQDNPFIQV